jgi:hypothetical protein
LCTSTFINTNTNKQTDKQTKDKRQTDKRQKTKDKRQTDKQTNRQTDKRQTNRQINMSHNQSHFLTENIKWGQGGNRVLSAKDKTIIPGRIGTAEGVQNDRIVKYYELLKDAKRWEGMSQVKLAREAERRANALLRGDIREYERQVHSHVLYTK